MAASTGTEPMLGALRYGLWPWPLHDIVEFAENALANRWILPTVGVVDMSAGIDWDSTVDKAANSHRLWFHSLPFVHDLVEAYLATGEARYLAHAEHLFLDYLRWSGASEEATAIAWSDEHAVANRCHVVIALLFAALKRQGEGDSDLWRIGRRHLRRHAEWLADDRHYVRSNRGTMMDRALLSAALALGEEPCAAEWRETALRRLGATFEVTFDADGCCSENSPEYHQLNVELFRAVDEFLRDHGLTPPADFAGRLERAERFAGLFLRDDGVFPTIGDSQAVLPRVPVKRHSGSAAFPTGGFAVLDGGELTLTVKCGGTSFVHRHIDDGSITLRHAGRDFIVDGGLYHYDNGDPVRRWLVSYRSHSGFYVEEAANVRFANFPDARALGRIRDFRDEGDRCTVAMEVTHVPGVRIEREVEVRQPDTVVIVDRLAADRPVKWRQQFLLHPDCTVAIAGGRAIVTNGGATLEIDQSGASPAVAVETGHYSPRFLEVLPAKCLVFTGEGDTVHLVTTLRCRSDPSADRSMDAPAPVPVGAGAPPPAMTVGIAHGDWSSRSPDIRPAGVDARGARFDCTLRDAYGYVQSHPGGFEVTAPGAGAPIPDGRATAVATVVVRVDGEPGPADSLGVFLLQFDAAGTRLGDGQTPHGLVAGVNRVVAPVALDPAARRFKLALRIAGYAGPLAILSAAVVFSQPAA